MALASTDIPQANDPERILRLARHLASGSADALPTEFAHPRDRLFYLGALRALGAIDAEDRPTERLAQLGAATEQRQGFAGVFASSPVGAAWIAWSGGDGVNDLDPASAADFLMACSGLSASTAQRRASTLRRWLEWCVRQEADVHASADGPPPPETAQVQPEPVPAPDVRRVPPPPPVPPARPDANRLLAGLARAGAHLRLDTVDLCFVAALFLRSDRGALASFEDEVLIDVFEQVCELVEPGAENPRKRATHAIQRLRDDRLLQRIDGVGLVRTGEYTLTGLGAAIVDFYLRDEALTKESLVLLTRMLHLNLTDIRTRARQATADEWRAEVVGPLSVTIRDLVDGIRRRQRGLDAQQEEVQEQIGRLLHEQWFAALTTCQRLLDTTSETLGELNEVLLRDTHQFVTVLQEIQQLASAASQTDAEEAAQRVIEQVDVIAAWGSARQRAWSEYYQYVHRFLQDVVRLDPDRALSQRLRDLVAGFAERPFALAIAFAPSVRLLRPFELRVDHPPVAREHQDRERPLPEVPAEDRRAWLEEQVLIALANGADTLAAVSAHVLGQVAEPDQFATAGRVAALVAELAYFTAPREATWQKVTDRIEIGDWTLDGLRDAP